VWGELKGLDMNPPRFEYVLFVYVRQV